jgi:hypothetical protein
MKIVSEKVGWNSLLEKYFQCYNDTYFRYEYFEIYKNNFNLKPEAFFWDDDNISVFSPHLIRSISKIGIFNGMDYFDLTTPYGYSGPLIITKNGKEEEIRESLLKFRKDYFTYAQERKYVSEFIRFHPIFETWRHFHQIFEIQYLNDTVVIDLTKSVEELKSQLSKNTRRYLKKSYKEFNLIKIVQHPSEEEFNFFLSLYEDTMKHQHASDKYFFDNGFIKDHFKLLNSLFIYCQNNNGETGSIGLFFKGEKILHYHLGATNYQFSSSPLRAVIWEAVLWAKKNGCTHLHLGGGLSQNDSLFAFKRGFSETTHPFYIGKIIFDDTVYKKLVQLNPDAMRNEHFFPLYRVGTNTNIVE